MEAQPTCKSAARRAARPIALLIVVALLAPTLAPVAQAASLALDLRQRIEVLHTSDPEASYVADAVAGFAEGADVNARIIAIDDAGAFLSAIRASTASILIVAAHGSSDMAGPDSGIVVGGERISRDDILGAIGQSGARRFFFASCGLGLPEEIDGRPVHSFSVPIDKKLAAVEALSQIGFIYAPENQQRLVGEYQMAIVRIGPVEELFLRWLMPIEPLRPDDGAGYSCYDDHSCDWDRAAEERRQESGQREGGGFAAPAPEFSQALQWLIDSGMAEMHGAGTDMYGVRWNFLFVIDFQCKILFDVMDLVIPGYSQVMDHLPEIKGVDFDYSLLRVEICGEMFFGLSQAGGAAGGGQMRLQIGQVKSVDFKFGFIKVSFSFYIGIIIEGTATLEDASGGRLEYLRWNLQLAIYLLIEGSWGWGSGTVRFDFLTPPWQRGDTFRNPFYRGATGTALAPPGIELPDVAGATELPVLEEAWTDYLILPLSAPAVNAIRRDPELAARLSEATGTDATTLAPGTLLNLGNPKVYRAVYGDRLAQTAAITRIQDPIVSANVIGPVGFDGCRLTADPARPLGGASAEVCVTGSTEDVSLVASASATGADVDSALLASPVGQWWEETYDVGGMRACRAVQDPGSRVCHSLALAMAAHSLVKSRSDEGAKASIRVRADVDNAAALIDLCAGLGANPICVQGTAGLNGIAPGEGGSFETIDVYASLAGPNGAIDQRANTALNSFGPTTFMGDTVCLWSALYPESPIEC